MIIIKHGDIRLESEMFEDLQNYMKMNTYLESCDPWFWPKLRSDIVDNLQQCALQDYLSLSLFIILLDQLPDILWQIVCCYLLFDCTDTRCRTDGKFPGWEEGMFSGVRRSRWGGEATGETRDCWDEGSFNLQSNLNHITESALWPALAPPWRESG